MPLFFRTPLGQTHQDNFIHNPQLCHIPTQDRDHQKSTRLLHLLCRDQTGWDTTLIFMSHHSNSIWILCNPLTNCWQSQKSVHSLLVDHIIFRCCWMIPSGNRITISQGNFKFLSTYLLCEALKILKKRALIDWTPNWIWKIQCSSIIFLSRVGPNWKPETTLLVGCRF